MTLHVKTMRNKSQIGTPRRRSVKLERHKASVAQTVNKLSDHILGKTKGLATSKDNASADGSIKNRSSIAFSATDGAYSILLLGDGNAGMFKKLYISNGHNPLEYTIMKVRCLPSIHYQFFQPLTFLL